MKADLSPLLLALERLCSGLQVALPAIPTSSNYYASSWDWRKRIETSASEEADRLPVTGRPVRGGRGVSVAVVEATKPERDRVFRLLERCTERAHRASGENDASALETAFAGLIKTVRGEENLFMRLYDSQGYKSYTREAL